MGNSPTRLFRARPQRSSAVLATCSHSRELLSASRLTELEAIQCVCMYMRRPSTLLARSLTGRVWAQLRALLFSLPLGALAVLVCLGECVSLWLCCSASHRVSSPSSSVAASSRRTKVGLGRAPPLLNRLYDLLTKAKVYGSLESSSLASPGILTAMQPAADCSRLVAEEAAHRREQHKGAVFLSEARPSLLTEAADENRPTVLVPKMPVDVT